MAVRLAADLRPSVDGSGPHMAKLQAASVPIAQDTCGMGQTDVSRYR